MIFGKTRPYWGNLNGVMFCFNPLPLAKQGARRRVSRGRGQNFPSSRNGNNKGPELWGRVDACKRGNSIVGGGGRGDGM